MAKLYIIYVKKSIIWIKDKKGGALNLSHDLSRGALAE